MSLTVVIYLPDGCGQQFSIPNGKEITASQYFQFMVATLKLPDVLAKKCFALWLKSSLLDVQLKPQHIPFKMVKQWPMLTERFSMASDQEKMQDEPALIFRRNAFLTIEDESQILDEAVLNILQMEARLNIQQGIYPCDAEDIEQLGALMCLSIEEKEKNDIKDVVKENLQTLVPFHMVKTKKTFLSRQQSIEERVLRCAKQVNDEADSVNCVVEFMKICWQLPYYGSVIFPGFVEKTHNHTWTSWFSAHSQVAVRVAINTNGVWVIDSEKKHVLIGLRYNEFNWEVTEVDSEAAEDEIVFPSLFLEFEDEKTKSNNLLQIVSKQAPMMNSMIESCVLAIREKEQLAAAKDLLGSGEASGSSKLPSKLALTSGSKRVRPLFERQNSVTSNHPEKLTLTKFSDSDDNAESDPSKRTESHNQPSKPVFNKRNLFKRMGSKQKMIGSTVEQQELL